MFGSEGTLVFRSNRSKDRAGTELQFQFLWLKSNTARNRVQTEMLYE